MRTPSDRPSSRTLGLALLGVLTVIFVVLLVVLIVKTKHDAAVAEAEAAHYRPPALAAATPSLPVVSVITDGLGVAPSASATLWTATASTALKVHVTPLAVAGSGYTTAGTATGATTFVQRASTVSASSKVVMFLGGAADSTASPTAVLRAATAALAAAHTTAPKAKLVVVGPAWPTTHPPAGVRAVRSALYQAAAQADAAWVDPIAADWLSGSSGLVATNGTAPTTAGETVLATKIEQALQPLLSDAG